MVNFEITLTDNQKIFPVNAEKLEKDAGLILEYALKNKKILADSALNGYDIADKTISVDVLLTKNEEIEELNSSYRGKDKPTDVLSFALFADSEDQDVMIQDEIPLGEVIISVETAKSQADANQIELEEEIRFLLCHGILHLLGFTHPDEESLELLIDIQNEILLAIK
ncbi:MAG TPA: rRNA maturation RNase YbeY [Candidatus Gastranaerophilales bacterium]|nr:rRNA maturation RNase YbeY [Candidatus Gastranaerophilales bacterium]